MVPLSSPLPFEIQTISKVALASDHRTSLLAVYPDADNNLKIWGFIDQGTDTYQFRNLEARAGFFYPGIFQVSAVAAGHLVVTIGFERIAEIRGRTLETRPLNIFAEGSAVVDALSSVADNLNRGSVRYVRRFGLVGLEDLLKITIRDELLTSIKRLLLRIQGYGHGGAFLITPTIRSKQLNVKYGLAYLRLASAVQKVSVLEGRVFQVDEEISELMETQDDSLPRGTYLDSVMMESQQEDATSELNGSLWFVSLLSRVDGLILFDKSFTVRGFGVEILVAAAPGNVWLANDAEGSTANREALQYERYGTRHRSMMRYCARVPGSVGFVVSQDGGARVMTQVDGDLMVWNNVQLQLDYSHRKYKGVPDEEDS